MVVPDHEQLRLGDGHRGGGSRRVPEQGHLPQQLAFFHQVEAPLAAGIPLDDVDRARMDEVRLGMGVVTFLESDAARYRRA